MTIFVDVAFAMWCSGKCFRHWGNFKSGAKIYLWEQNVHVRMVKFFDKIWHVL